MIEFKEFQKIARLSRECVVTEKLDGTNASIYIPDLPDEVEGPFLVGSRNKWITPTDDNYGFARWAHAHVEELLALGPGHHFGEWWGGGIQRGYGLKEKRFSLFNTTRWTAENVPGCVSVVPTLYRGMFDTQAIAEALASLAQGGSVAAPGFTNPEGVVIYHVAGNVFFKKTILKDESPKSVAR